MWMLPAGEGTAGVNKAKLACNPENNKNTQTGPDSFRAGFSFSPQKNPEHFLEGKKPLPPLEPVGLPRPSLRGHPATPRGRCSDTGLPPLTGQASHLKTKARQELWHGFQPAENPGIPGSLEPGPLFI
jgi:hypothetical protein